MDFKKFGKVILILGIAILLYGGFQWLSNASSSLSENPPYSDWELRR